jgi:hypothetical protein
MYEINRQSDLLCYRADLLPDCPCRDALVRRIEALNTKYTLLLLKVGSSNIQQA